MAHFLADHVQKAVSVHSGKSKEIKFATAECSLQAVKGNQLQEQKTDPAGAMAGSQLEKTVLLLKINQKNKLEMEDWDIYILKKYLERMTKTQNGNKKSRYDSNTAFIETLK